MSVVVLWLPHGAVGWSVVCDCGIDLFKKFEKVFSTKKLFQYGSIINLLPFNVSIFQYSKFLVIVIIIIK